MKVTHTIKDGKTVIYEYSNSKYYQSVKMSPEEGVEYYSSLYPGEEIRYNEEYEVFVSDQGNIFSRSKKRGKHSICKNNNGYCTFSRGRHDKYTTVHKLVMKTFDKYVEGMDIDHINNIRDDNRLCNLQMLSHADNVKKREKSSDRSVYCIELNKTFKSLADAAREVGFTAASLCMHLRGKSKTFAGYHWRYVE